MKRAIVYLMVFSWVMTGFTADPHYIGSTKCAKMCHNSPKKGAIYTVWQKSPHAKAFTTLGRDTSKIVAASVGITGDPRKAPECLRCHVTAFDAPRELINPTCSDTDGVGCEACHGPASDYCKFTSIKKHKTGDAPGMVEQKETVCIKCHNKESPTYKPFVFKEAVKKDAHLIPGRKRDGQ